MQALTSPTVSRFKATAEPFLMLPSAMRPFCVLKKSENVGP